MPLSKNDIDRLREIFNIPEFIVPWLDRFYSNDETHLVLLLADEPLSVNGIAERWEGDER